MNKWVLRILVFRRERAYDCTRQHQRMQSTILTHFISFQQKQTGTSCHIRAPLWRSRGNGDSANAFLFEVVASSEAVAPNESKNYGIFGRPKPLLFCRLPADSCVAGPEPGDAFENHGDASRLPRLPCVGLPPAQILLYGFFGNRKEVENTQVGARGRS